MSHIVSHDLCLLDVNLHSNCFTALAQAFYLLCLINEKYTNPGFFAAFNLQRKTWVLLTKQDGDSLDLVARPYTGIPPMTMKHNITSLPPYDEASVLMSFKP